MCATCAQTAAQAAQGGGPFTGAPLLILTSGLIFLRIAWSYNLSLIQNSEKMKGVILAVIAGLIGYFLYLFVL